MASRAHPVYFELRPDRTDDGMELDEIVAYGAESFHMEALSAHTYWLCLNFPGGERLTWTIHLQPRRRRLRARVNERPRGVEDRTKEPAE